MAVKTSLIVPSFNLKLNHSEREDAYKQYAKLPVFQLQLFFTSCTTYPKLPYYGCSSEPTSHRSFRGLCRIRMHVRTYSVGVIFHYPFRSLTDRRNTERKTTVAEVVNYYNIIYIGIWVYPNIFLTFCTNCGSSDDFVQPTL